jgi:hypothetical protein
LFVNFLGYYIFRDANGEKNNFRNGQNPKSGSFSNNWRESMLTLDRPQIHDHR